jgi:hypothetical protein
MNKFFNCCILGILLVGCSNKLIIFDYENNNTISKNNELKLCLSKDFKKLSILDTIPVYDFYGGIIRQDVDTVINIEYCQKVLMLDLLKSKKWNVFFEKKMLKDDVEEIELNVCFKDEDDTVGFKIIRINSLNYLDKLKKISDDGFLYIKLLSLKNKSKGEISLVGNFIII